jgi:hypothetical protein
VIGGIADADMVIEATSVLEACRIARYDARPRWRDHEPLRMLDAVLARHAVDAGLRLAWLTDRGSSISLARVAAA